MYEPELDPDMSLEDKIQWLVDNECNETGEAMEGLQRFMNYGLQNEEAINVLECVKDRILETYDICKEEYLYEKEQEEQHGPETAADLIWSDILGRTSLLNTLDDDTIKKMKESWTRTIRNCCGG